MLVGKWQAGLIKRQVNLGNNITRFFIDGSEDRASPGCSSTLSLKQQALSHKDARSRRHACARQINTFQQRMILYAIWRVGIRNHPKMITRVHIDRRYTTVRRLDDLKSLYTWHANAEALTKIDVRFFVLCQG